MMRRLLMGSLDLNFLSESEVIFAAMTSPPDLARKIAINTLISKLITGGVWDKLDRLFVLAAPAGTDAALNWLTATPTLNPTGSTSFEADRGYTGDGATGSINTNFIPSASSLFARNDHSFGAWMRTAGSGVLLGVSDSVKKLSVATNGTTSYTVEDTGADTVSATGVGHIGVVRTVGSEYEIYKSGALVKTVTSSSDTLPTLAFALLARNADGFPADFSTAQISIAYFGAGLTAGEVAILHNALDGYMTAIGA